MPMVSGPSRVAPGLSAAGDGRSMRVMEPSGDGPATDEVGVGPYPRPWPDDPRLDPELLAGGDRRNVVDAYRYWRIEAIVDDLDRRRHPFHVAIENWTHDRNIGAVVRNANAFLAEAVHIVGRRRWNRRGAMVTERYQHVVHHPDVDALAAWAGDRGLPLLGVDNLAGAVDLRTAPLPPACVLLFGQEGPGLSAAARDAVDTVLSIPQYGSTRSINAGVASGIAMYEWIRRHAARPRAAPGPGYGQGQPGST
jgi:tRNA(Leu) C34 or U34 (ribose-2'-O)-methylase TrmL